MIHPHRLGPGPDFVAFVAIAAVAAVEPVLAAPVPGPVIGAGLPALALFAGGYWLIRQLRRDDGAP